MQSFNALGIYIFAGGFTLGVRQAGFKVLGHFEDGEYGVATTMHNQPELPGVYTNPEEWPDEFTVQKGRGKNWQRVPVDFIYANPPCAIWSMAGKAHIKGADFSKGYAEGDDRVNCVLRAFEQLKVHRPIVWVWETVAMAFKRGRPLIDKLAEEAAELGYACSLVLLDGAAVGLPQRRRRLFIVFHQIEIPWTDPRGRFARRTVRDTIGGLMDPGPTGTSKLIRRLGPHVEQGEKLINVWERRHPQRLALILANKDRFGDKVKGRPGFLYQRTKWDAVCHTATGGTVLLHPEENRYLTLLEIQLLCGYPDWYKFVGSNPFGQCCQAVLPPVGHWLARQVYEALANPHGLTSDNTSQIEISDFKGDRPDYVKQIDADIGNKILARLGSPLRTRIVDFLS